MDNNDQKNPVISVLRSFSRPQADSKLKKKIPFFDLTTYGNSNGKKEERKSAFLNNSLLMDIFFLLLRIKTFVINFPNITYCFPLLFDHYYFRSLEQFIDQCTQCSKWYAHLQKSHSNGSNKSHGQF